MPSFVLRPSYTTPFVTNEQFGFGPLLDLFNEPVHRANSMRRCKAAHQGAIGTFTPRFDIKESKDGYELHGELPGVEQKNINIEWSDGNTLTIHGRTEYSRTESNAPNAPVQEASPVQHAVPVQEDGYEAVEAHSEDDQPAEHYHKPTVEDSPEPSENSTVAAPQQNEKNEVAKAPAVEAITEKNKYWIAERSVGEFHRSFSFPGHIAQDLVKASLKDGILSVTVPKAEKPKARRIQVE